MKTMTTEDQVVRHWSHDSLDRAIREGLIAMGRDLESVQLADLALVDELHMGGHEATVRLAAQMGLAPGMSLLDIGSGLGGPARFFAGQYGCTDRKPRVGNRCANRDDLPASLSPSPTNVSAFWQ